MTTEPSDNGYPQPSDTTVKALYATAFRCAHPDCPKPLFRLNNETGERILNSRIAHIHARRPRGPRWKAMPAEENRAYDNLLLLCIEHSYEVDDKALEDQFPPDLLREWKQRQVEEYERIQQSWPLNDEETAEVVAASFDTTVQAGAVMSAVRAIAVLTARTRRTRGVVAARIAAWQETVEKVRRSIVMWDEDGERVYAEPSAVETGRHQRDVAGALSQAEELLVPRVDAVHVELAAVRTGDPRLTPWCEWVSRSADEVLKRAAQWPMPPPFEDDGQLDAALAELTRATDALAAGWRGDDAEPPPAAPAAADQAPEPDPLAEHRALLDRARPFARVSHRPYDAELEERLLANLPSAASLPPVPSLLALDLHANAHLAAAVARNTDDDTIERLIEQYRAVQPLAAAAALLRELRLLLEESARETLAARATVELMALLADADWRIAETWQANEMHCRWLLALTSHVSSSADVSARLGSALEKHPDLLGPILLACAEWREHRDSYQWERLLGFSRNYSSLPDWWPSRVGAEIRVQLSHVSATSRWESERYEDDVERLAAEVLYLESLGRRSW